MKYTRKIKHFSKRFVSLVRSYPGLAAGIITLLYLLIFQFSFLTSGDAWAESFAEYLDESMRRGWSEVLAQNWAGYFTLIPSFLSKAYVSLGLPLGYIDYFHRIATIAFVVLTTVLIAAKFNAQIIRNDLLRIAFALLVVVSMTDLSSFSFINVWYIGFVPIIMWCLHTEKIDRRIDASMGLFGFLVSLTKPLPLIAPLALLRMLRTKQLLGAILVFIAATFQSVQILFNDDRGIASEANFKLTTFLSSIFTGSGIEFLKLIHIVPVGYWMVIAVNLLFLFLLIAIWKKRGIIFAGSLATLYAYCLYTYLMAPDAPVYFSLERYQDIYYYNLKSQREILIYALQLLIIFVGAPSLLRIISNRLPAARKLFSSIKERKLTSKLCLIIFVCTFMLIYRPIDVVSAGISNTPIDAFREQLSSGKEACVPLAPTPVFFSEANWLFEYKTRCITQNFDTNLYKPNFKSMQTSLGPGTSNGVISPKNAGPIMTLLLPIKSSNQGEEIVITESTSRLSFSSTVPWHIDDSGIVFVAFDISSIPDQQRAFNFTFHGPGQTKIGSFDNGSPMYYLYYKLADPMAN